MIEAQRLRRAPTARTSLWPVVATVVARIRRSPGTFALLAIISATSLALELVAPHGGHRLLQHVSSNLAHIENLRFGVLVGSAFWLEDTAELFPWLLLFTVVAAPAEAWLGTGRWIVVFAAGHVGATLATLGGIWIAIETGAASAHLAHSVDVGVSYGFFAVAAILAYRVPRRWRPAYIVAVAAYPVAGTVLFQGFADFGHLLALAIGFALYPLARRA